MSATAEAQQEKLRAEIVRLISSDDPNDQARGRELHEHLLQTHEERLTLPPCPHRLGAVFFVHRPNASEPARSSIRGLWPALAVGLIVLLITSLICQLLIEL